MRVFRLSKGITRLLGMMEEKLMFSKQENKENERLSKM